MPGEVKLTMVRLHDGSLCPLNDARSVCGSCGGELETRGVIVGDDPADDVSCNVCSRCNEHYHRGSPEPTDPDAGWWWEKR